MDSDLHSNEPAAAGNDVIRSLDLPAWVYPLDKEYSVVRPASEFVDLSTFTIGRSSERLRPRAQSMVVADRRRKRLFDLVGAGMLLVLGAPVFVGVTLVVLIASGHPILFAQERIGRGGRRFRCWKFRTMRRDSDRILAELLAADPQAREEWTKTQKLRNDPRVTRVGRFLRRFSFDELPQLFNVLNGDMSLVGPRPVVQSELNRYGRAARLYLALRPGITGLWQISGRGQTSYSRRVVLDGYYARNQTLRLDLIILLKTIGAVFSGRGAY